MGKKLIGFIALAFLLILLQCHSDKTPLSPANISDCTGSLIPNCSFEENGEPTLQFWESSDTSAVHFSGEVPPGGGRWSVFVEASWFGPLLGYSHIAYRLPLKQGVHIFRLTFYAKRTALYGSMSLFQIHGNETNQLKTVTITDSTWTKYQVQDTLTAAPGDSLLIFLTGGGTEVVYSATYYDLVKLTELSR